MSHFVVMAVTKTQQEEELKAALQPFHEYECTGIQDQYVEFVDCHDEIVEAWAKETSRAYRSPNGTIYDGYEDLFYREPTVEEAKVVDIGSGCGHGIRWESKDWGDGKGYRTKVHFVPHSFEEFRRPVSDKYESMEEYAKECCGYNIIENGRIGHYTNPNAKWDWWVVGGRWSNWLCLRDGTKVDAAAKGDIDFDGMTQEARDEAAQKYDKVMDIVAGRTWKSWEECKASEKDIDAARTLYNGQQVVKDIRQKADVYFDEDEFLKTRDEYIDAAAKTAFVPFAILVDGKWMQRGEMGWWGLVSDEKDDWPTMFHEIFKDISAESFITIVDCHI